LTNKAKYGTFSNRKENAMFLRVKSYKNKDGSLRDYLFLVATKRIGGRVRQITVANFGRLEQANELIPELVDKLSEFSNKLKVIDLSKDVRNDWVKEYGPVLIYRKIWEDLGLGSYIRAYLKRKKIKFKAGDVLFSSVLNRLTEPKSELATHRWVKKYYGLSPVEDKNQWYRALDFIVEHKDRIEHDLFKAQLDLFHQEIDIVLMDTTSVVYWGDGKKAEDILDYGYSKQKRFDLKQVIVGIFMTKDGVPIGHEVYPGNTNDIKAFQQMIETINQRYKIRRVIIVCDRGMVSKANLDQLKSEGYEYIVGMKMRQLKYENARDILDETKMQSVGEKLKGREVEYTGRQLVACYNEEQSEADKLKRQEILTRLAEKLKTQGLKSLLVAKEYSKYLKIEAKKPEIDEERIEKEKLYDGKFVLETNTELNCKEVVTAYKDLWRVEAAFRTLKNELAMGPIYHYSERRIRAHIFICFLALVLKVSLEKDLKKINKKLSLSKVTEDIKQLKATKLDIKDKEYILRTELQGDAHLAFKAVGLKIPPRIIKGIQRNRDETVVLRL